MTNFGTLVGEAKLENHVFDKLYPGSDRRFALPRGRCVLFETGAAPIWKVVHAFKKIT